MSRFLLKSTQKKGPTKKTSPHVHCCSVFHVELLRRDVDDVCGLWLLEDLPEGRPAPDTLDVQVAVAVKSVLGSHVGW